MLHDLKIRNKILLGFSFIALFVGIAGLIGIRGADRIRDSFNGMVKTSMPALEALLEIKSTASEIESQVVTLELLKSEPLQAEGTFGASRKFELMANIDRMDTWIERYLNLVDPNDKHKISHIQSIRESTKIIGLVALEFIRFKERDMPDELKLAQKQKLEVEIANLKKSVQAAMEDEKTHLQQNNRTVDTIIAKTIEASLFVLGIAILFALLAGALLSNLIAKPVMQLRDVANFISQGNLTERAKNPFRDEIGDLAHSFNRMTESLLEANRRTEHSVELEKGRAEELQVAYEELERRQNELKKTQALLAQASRLSALGLLGAGIAHELNQPLAGIQGYADLIANQLPPNSPIHADIQVILKQVKRMSDIINNIRSFSRGSKAAHVLTDIHKPVEDALSLVNTLLKNHNIVTQKNFSQNLPKVMANSNQLQQVFINLFTNAKDALDKKGSGNIWITSKHLRNGGRDQVEVTFKNDGPLIPEEVMDLVFDPFFSTKEIGKGMGLGLSICHGIIKEHGGEIRVENKIAEGVSFIITLPVSEGV